MVEWEGEALGRLRQGLYRFFASSFLYPEESRLAILIETTRRLDQDYLARFAFHHSWMRLRGAMQEEAMVSGLGKQYIRLFSAGLGGAICPPYESFYLALPGQPASLFALQLEREYAGLGLALSPDYENLPDHVSAELEAMAFLCGKEAEAWSDRACERVVKVIEDERTFLQRHLEKWFFAFAERVMEEAAGTIYGTIAEAADAFIRHDLELSNLLLREVSV
ncbi:MAG: molecular chaperone TorD family protein [Candidatus Thermoplasmatota archaeon]|nr:molecular chaperone TorD family protein [Candidatus Thermoplasmatota archaeon]